MNHYPYLVVNHYPYLVVNHYPYLVVNHYPYLVVNHYPYLVVNHYPYLVVNHYHYLVVCVCSVCMHACRVGMCMQGIVWCVHVGGYAVSEYTRGVRCAACGVCVGVGAALCMCGGVCNE